MTERKRQVPGEDLFEFTQEKPSLSGSKQRSLKSARALADTRNETVEQLKERKAAKLSQSVDKINLQEEKNPLDHVEAKNFYKFIQN